MILPSTKKNMIFGCLFTGIYDVNRNTTLQNDDFTMVKEWYDSIIKLNLKGILFHNNLSNKTCQEHSNENIEFIQLEYNPIYKPNVFRYLIYQDYLSKYDKGIENIFFTDVSDVVVVKNPFTDSFFVENDTSLFCGDEPKILANDWMIAHSEHLRSRIRGFAHYEEKFKNETLLNCGIFGGNIKIIKQFIEQLALIHQLYNFDNKTEYTGDMGAFNYLIRSFYNTIFLHGAPINTEFKAYQIERNDCWFRHK